MFPFTFLAKQSVFGCQFFQKGIFAAQLINKLFLLGFQLVYYSQLAAYQAFGRGLLYVVAAVYGFEETVNEGIEVLTFESGDGIAVLAVGLVFGQCPVEDGAVVVLAKFTTSVLTKISDGRMMFLRLMPSSDVQRLRAT